MNAEQKEKEEAAWKAAYEASIAAANAQKAFFDTIREASEEDLASFLAGRARMNEQTHKMDQNDGAQTALACPAPKNDARTAPGATNPQATPPNSSNATASSAPAPKAATKDDSLPQSQLFLDWNPMEDEHKRSPSPFSELPERGCGRLDGCRRTRKNKFKK